MGSPYAKLKIQYEVQVACLSLSVGCAVPVLGYIAVSSLNHLRLAFCSPYEQ
jgi:hypothetical protein